MLPKHAPLKARVVRWLPICDQPTPGAPEDIALLEIATETPLPPDARPLDLLTLPDGHYAGRTFRAYGLPERMEDDGEWANGRLGDLVASGRVQLRHDVGRRAIEHGFSGAAVWDDQQEAALGMIVAIRGRDEFASAYMIPAALLLDACPELEPARRALNPYKGLQAFAEADAPYFFGREELVAEFEQKLNAAPFLTMLGPSGSGKSSAICAGLLPCLKAADPGLLVVEMCPGDEPLKALTEELIPLLEPEFSETDRLKEQNKLYAALLANEIALPDVLDRIIKKQRATSLLLVVDQFEELYTLGEMTEERRRFVELLLDALACAERRSACGLLIALRSDFFDRTNSVPALSQAISAQHHLVPAMTDAELRRAIAEPARVAGQPLDAMVVDELLRQMDKRDGALPLLEFALTEIWNGMTKGADALETLTRIGGVGGALAKKAQTIFDGLTPDAQEIARRAFLAMMRLGEGAKDTRRRDRLSDVIAHGDDPAQTHRALTPFAQREARLLTLGENAVDITHEALLEHWDSLKAWIEASRADLRFRDRLRDAARHWDEIGRKAGALWQTPDLEQLIAFERRAGKELTTLEVEFFRAAKWRKRRARLTTFAVMLALLGLTAASTIGLLRAQEAEQKARRN
ncbi:WD-40 repeat protein [Candidatus Moduliflexus flocculans]|uniref:WD-40 repeat protein n=1 Tax=Candidatus Moduliflexus flocculans TaxID=1499966 RepID=A0A0S6VY50_9BACT|nr:WD-40 repeat protein [Candidatus Moduliflexus flocculans]